MIKPILFIKLLCAGMGGQNEGMGGHVRPHP